MKYLEDTYVAWLQSSINCCGPLNHSSPPVEQPMRVMRIEHHQPHLIPPPVPLSQAQEDYRPLTRGREWVDRSRSFASRASSRGSFSVRRKLNAYNGFHSGRPPKLPKIGAPIDFRHVDTSMPPLPRRAPMFRPLELSIYMPENQLSPILPHFAVDDREFSGGDELTYPAAAMTHSRSESAMSFRIPRKPVRSSSDTWASQYKARPQSLSAQELLVALEKEMPKEPLPARLRANTEPPAYERVKSALHERYELEQKLRDIEEVIEERKSIYLNSRPVSRATSFRPESIYSESTEPMPPPPLLPPLPLSQRPRTAPSQTIHIPTRHKSFTEASAAFTTPPRSQASQSPSPVKYSPSANPLGQNLPFSARNPYQNHPAFRPSRSLHHTQEHPALRPAYTLPKPPPRSLNRQQPLTYTLPPPPPPPLPLVLQTPHPQLRKKKSFSRVSNWLFPSQDHSRTTSLDSITNTPKNITAREGFYQCIDLRSVSPDTDGHQRQESVSTVSTLESELDAPTLPTTWSPHSSPSRFGELDVADGGKRGVVIRTLSVDSQAQEDGEEMPCEKNFELGIPERLPGRNSVGVAF